MTLNVSVLLSKWPCFAALWPSPSRVIEITLAASHIRINGETVLYADRVEASC